MYRINFEIETTRLKVPMSDVRKSVTVLIKEIPLKKQITNAWYKYTNLESRIIEYD